MKKLKLFSLLMLLFVGVTNMWGAAASLPVDYSFDDGKSSLPTGVTQSGLGDDYKASNAPYCLKFDGNGDYVQIEVNAAADVITIGVKQYSTSSSTIKIQGSANGSSFTDIQSFTLNEGQNKTKSFSTTNSIATNYRYFRVTRSGGSNFGLGTLAITAAASSCSNTVTITKGAETNGTYTLSATSVCGDGDGEDVTISDITPAAGYEFDEITTSASGTVDNVNKKVTGITAATTITVKFKELQKYTITWNNNGVTSTSQVYEGEKPVFPTTPESCDATSTTFIGWATEAWAGKLASISAKTVYTSADAMPAVTGAVTYYAVFAKAGGEASNLFSWAGGSSADFAAIEGVVLSADGSDYAAANDPYLIKWNGTGKYAIIPVSAQPGKVSIGVKMIGGSSSSKITVQESTSTTGSFTDVEELTISGATNDEVDLETTKSFKATTRAIKLYYTKGSNVGLGPISIEGVAPISDYMTTCSAAGQCVAPAFSIAGGTYNATQDVELTCETDGATIYYTTDGTTPSSSNGTEYNSAIEVNQNMTIKAIAVKADKDDSEVAEAVYTLKPATPAITGDASFIGTTNVTLSCETEGAEIRYTTNGDDPTASSTLYEDPFEISASCTVKAIAIKANWTNSDATSQEFTKITTYTTIDGLLEKAKEVTDTPTDVYVTFNNWVVSAVKNSNAYVTDGTKGFIVYASSHGFAVNDKLSGTAACKVQLYRGSIELTNLTASSEGLTVTHDGVITPVEVNIADLDTINTGAPIILKKVTYNGTNLVDANSKTIKPFNTLYSDMSFTNDNLYNVTGIYLQYNSTKEILPRSAEDILKHSAVTFSAPEHGTLVVKKQVGENWEAITSGNYFVEGTVLKIEAEPESADYKLALTVNGEAFTSGNTFTIGTAAVAVSATFTEKADPEISWSNSGAAVEVQLGGDYTALPTLTKGDLTVTCESTDETVATVDNDGVVTPKGVGTTTIKAIFAGDETTKAKTVSYELTVTAPDFYIAGDFTEWGSNKIPVVGESKTLNLAAGSHKLKVVDGEDWKGFSNLTVSEIIAGLTADGEGNICFTLAEEGNVTVTYTNELFKLEGDFTPQTVKLKGGWDSWAEHTMTVSDDKKSASVKMTLTAAENVQFGIDIDGDYRANNYYYHRDYTGTTGITGNDGNMKLTSDIDGDYTFTWTFGTNGINITFPMVEAGLSWGVDAASAYTAGKSYTLPTLANPNSRPVSYESSNEAVATIANDGKITLVAAGTTVIKATSEATSLYTAGEASYTLNVYAPTVVITGNLTVSAYEYGDEFSYAGLGAKAVYGDESEYELPSGGLQWTYNPTRVTENGKVQVTVTYATISSAAKEFDVTVKTHAVTFEQPEGGTLVVKKGETTVSSGEAFVKGTELTITATRESADYVFASLTVNGEDFTSGNTFTVGTADIEVAAAFNLKPAAPISWESTEDDVREYGKSYENNDWRTLYNNGNFEVTVTSSNAAVIETMKPYNSSNTTGIWYPEAVKGVGTTTITATTAATDSYRQTSVSYKIVVKAGLDPTAFGWSADAATIYIAAAEKVFPTLTNDLDLDVTYSSSDETKATIDENGVITPKAVGTTTISAIFAGNETYVAKTVTYTLTIAAGDGTALDNTADETKAVKFLENGQIFILRGDKVYTVDGQLVK